MVKFDGAQNFACLNWMSNKSNFSSSNGQKKLLKSLYFLRSLVWMPAGKLMSLIQRNFFSHHNRCDSCVRCTRMVLEYLNKFDSPIRMERREREKKLWVAKVNIQIVMESIFHVIWLSAFSTFLFLVRSRTHSLEWRQRSEEHFFLERLIIKFI